MFSRRSLKSALRADLSWLLLLLLAIALKEEWKVGSEEGDGIEL